MRLSVPWLCCARWRIHGARRSCRAERTIARAIEAGVNYFDPAVQYGDGSRENNLGASAKTETGQRRRRHQVRLPPADFGRIATPSRRR